MDGFLVGYEYFDPDLDVSEDEQDRINFTWEFFPQPHTQIRVGVRISDGIPQNDLQNADLIFAELHAFF